MKFKLNKNDLKSLETSIALIENPVLQAAAIDVTTAEFSGGNYPPDFAKVDFAKATWAQA